MPNPYTVLPENECCFGPYEITCTLPTMGGSNIFYDSSKTLLKCKNAPCTSSCEAEYGPHYNIIKDFTDDCPNCRECYLEDTSLGRYYTLTITNCQVIITNYLSENDCGTCLEEADVFCFSLQESGDIDPDNPKCYTSFTFDGQTFTVYGDPGQCSSEINCEDCWKKGNEVIGKDFVLPDTTIDSCEITENEETESTPIIPVEVEWHNSPVPDGEKNTGCSEEVLIPTSEDERNIVGRSFQNPDITISSSGHALIAYEDRSFTGLTKINFSEQETTVQDRVIGYRSLGKGRLINSSADGEKGKIRIYDDILTTTTGSIGFKNGPFAGKMYTISSIIKEPNNNDIMYSVSGDNLFSFYYDRIYNKIYTVNLGNLTKIYVLDPVTSAVATEIFMGSPALTYVTSFIADSENRIYYCLKATDNTGANYEIHKRGFDSISWSNILSFPSTVSHYNTAFEIDIDNEYLYYVKSGEIRRIKTDGTGDSGLITTSETDILSLKIDKTYNKLYWSEYNNGKILRSNLDGTDIETIINNSNYRIFGLDVQENEIYWSDTSNQAIKSAKKDGSNIFVHLSLNSIDKIPTVISINENSSKIYFINGDSSGINDFPIIANGKLNKSVLTTRPFCEIEFNIT